MLGDRKLGIRGVWQTFQAEAKANTGTKEMENWLEECVERGIENSESRPETQAGAKLGGILEAMPQSLDSKRNNKWHTFQLRKDTAHDGSQET